MQRAEDKACNIRAGDVGDAEVFLGGIGEEHTQRKAEYRHTALVGIALVDQLEDVVADKAHAHREHNEQHRMQHHVHRVRIGVLEADDEGQHDDADNVVDDSGAGYQRADMPLEPSQLFKRLNGDADRCGGHDGADENG